MSEILKESVEFFGLPFPPSTNSAYATNRKTNRRFPSKELIEFKNAVAQYFGNQKDTYEIARDTMLGWLAADYYFKIEIVYYSPRWMTKSGTIRKMDHANREKCLVDAVFDQFKIDDCLIVETVLKKGLTLAVENVSLKLTPVNFTLANENTFNKINC